ncbi:MAG: hypothetical protein GY757_39590, partial [bacterium]|nr:hypothetical protein [bacterium]
MAVRAKTWTILLIAALMLGGLPALDGAVTGSTKFLRIFNKQEYRHHPQNWMITRGPGGIIFAANNGGVLYYDGSKWGKLILPNWTARSLAVDSGGTIFAGGKNEMGYIAPNSKGTLKFISLVKHLQDRHKKFKTVWNTYATNEGIIFETTRFLFRWNGTAFKVWEPETVFNASFLCGDRLFIHERKSGLKQINGNSLELAPGGASFTGKKLYMLVSYEPESNRYLIGTRSNGFYIYDYTRGTLAPFPTGVDDYLKDNRLYHGIQLRSGRFAAATLRGGLVIFNTRGALVDIYDTTSGLPTNNVKSVY